MTNLYEDHPFMISQGRFWRCRHGRTGYWTCWRCGLKHPWRFLRHWWSKM